MRASLKKLKRQTKDETKKDIRQRLIEWRRQGAITRVKKLMKPARARSLGYKAKQSYVVVRTRVRRGGFSKSRPRAGRRPKALGVVKHKVAVSTKEEAIGRTLRRYPNLQPVGAYKLAEDGRNMWYEVILVDPRQRH